MRSVGSLPDSSIAIAAAVLLLGFLHTGESAGKTADVDLMKELQEPGGASDRKAAIKYADEAIKINPKNAHAYLIKGKAFAERQPDKALDSLNKAIELDPKLAEAYLERAKCTFLLDENNISAFADLRKAIKLSPRIEGAYDYLGIGYASQKDYTKALECFNRAIASDPDNRKQYFHRATVYEAIGKDNKAIEDYSSVIKRWPADKHVHERRAGAYEHCGQLERAYADLTEAIKRSRNFGQYYDRRARVLSRLHRHREAIADYSTLLSLNDLDFDFFKLRGDEYMAVKDYGKAIKDYDEAINLAPDVPLLHEKKARVLVLLGQMKEAAKERASAAKLYTRPAERKL